MNCPLCNHSGKPFYKDTFFVCENCFGLYRNRKYYVDARKEREVYERHNNDVNDPRYQQFVSPITCYVLDHFKPDQTGLDFGSGTGPVISKMLQDQGYRIYQYDPFFANDVALLNETYDYIVCCEVAEHFHQPDVEFRLLHSLLKPCGALVCMTHLYDDTIAFPNWYYKNDPTHVFIYRKETLHYIADRFGFKNVEIDNRLFVLNGEVS